MKGYHNESKNFKWKFKYCRKKSKKIYDFHTLSTKIHKVFHKMWINIFLKFEE